MLFESRLRTSEDARAARRAMEAGWGSPLANAAGDRPDLSLVAVVEEGSSGGGGGDGSGRRRWALRVGRSVLDCGAKLSPHLAWGDLLPFVQRALNRTPNSKTKKSPSELMFGSRVDLDREIFDGDDFPNRTPVRVGGYVQALMEAQEGILRRYLLDRDPQVLKG